MRASATRKDARESTGSEETKLAHARFRVGRGGSRLTATVTASAGLLLLAGCGQSASTNPTSLNGAEVTTPSTSSQPLADLAAMTDGGCPPDTSPPPTAQITMVYKQVLFGALPDGSDLHCLIGPPISHVLTWAGDGTTLLDGQPPQADPLTSDTPSNSYAADNQTAQALTRPHATGVYVVNPDDGSISRFDFDTRDWTGITGDVGATDVAVSPDGQTLAVSATGAASSEVLLVTVDGSRQSTLVSVPAEVDGNTTTYAMIRSLTWVSATEVAWLQTAPNGENGPVTLNVVDATTGTPVSTATLGAPLGTQAALGLVATGGMAAVEFGSCTSQVTTTVFDTSTSTPVPESVPVPGDYAFTAPIGWLPNGRLVLLAKQNSCTGPGDVLLWAPGSTATALFASGATEAAVRTPGTVAAPGQLESLG